jgi:dihydroorotate dehydrogenase (NAD+) catalytic subunit
VKLGSLRLKRPVLPASGTYGRELVPFAPPEALGAVVTRTYTLLPWLGNPPPRLVETPGGLLSATGYENPGLQAFLQEELPFWQSFDVPLVVSLAGTKEELAEMALLFSRFPRAKGISAVELNIAMLVEQGFTLESLVSLVRTAKQCFSCPVIVKLPPELDIAKAAKLFQRAGADILALVHGFPGISFAKPSKFCLSSGVGRLSGPAIKPLALKCVQEAAETATIPVIGMGGIFSTQDALEFFEAGAKAVAVGTASFVNPRALVEISEGLVSHFSSLQQPESRFQFG